MAGTSPAMTVGPRKARRNERKWHAQSDDRRDPARERNRAERGISARSRACPQGVPRRAGARRRAVPVEARPRSRADGRERRRQVDADEDHLRHLHAGLRLVQAQGPGNQAHLAARRAALRHCDDPSGTEPDGLYDGGGKHLAAPRAAQRAAHRQPSRDAPPYAGSVRPVGDRPRPEIEVRDLSVANRQMVEIAKAVSYDSDILIMDEPTSRLQTRRSRICFASSAR